MAIPGDCSPCFGPPVRALRRIEAGFRVALWRRRADLHPRMRGRSGEPTQEALELHRRAIERLGPGAPAPASRLQERERGGPGRG